MEKLDRLRTYEDIGRRRRKSICIVRRKIVINVMDIMHLKMKKAVGPDQVGNEMIKHGSKMMKQKYSLHNSKDLGIRNHANVTEEQIDSANHQKRRSQ